MGKGIQKNGQEGHEMIMMKDSYRDMFSRFCNYCNVLDVLALQTDSTVGQGALNKSWDRGKEGLRATKKGSRDRSWDRNGGHGLGQVGQVHVKEYAINWCITRLSSKAFM